MSCLLARGRLIHAPLAPRYELHRETWCVGNRAREQGGCSGTGSRPGNTEHLTAQRSLHSRRRTFPDSPPGRVCAILGTATPAVWGFTILHGRPARPPPMPPLAVASS